MKGKEVKIGLSIIAVLLCVFGAVLFNRLSRPDEGAEAVAQNGSKTTDKKQDAAKKPSAKKSGTPAARSKSDQDDDGPSLPVSSVAKRSSSGLSSRKAEQPKARDPWASRLPAEKPADRYQDNAAAQDTATQDTDPQNSDADRYGRRYGAAADNSSETDSDSAFAADTSNSDVADEAPAEASNGADGGPAFQPASDLAGGQPADGYQALDDAGDARTTHAAANDPFPSASRRPGANRGLPIGGALKSSPAEVELTPIEDADSPPLRASHDAEIAEPSGAEPADADSSDAEQEPPRGFGSHKAASRSAQPRFSAASRQRAAAEEPANDADDVSSRFSRPDRDFSENRGGGEVYFAEANDSFATISKKVYGSEGYFKALHEYNREQYPNPNLIDPGDEIATPDVAVLEQNYPKLCPKRRNAPAEPREGGMHLTSDNNSARGGRTYLVAEGDTLFDIAKRELGKASRWREIYDLNQDQLGEDFNYLSPGTELRLPGGGEKPDPVADRRYLDRTNRRR